MADHRDAIRFIKKWEGGLTGHPTDTASNNPAPCGNDPRYDAPYHTNKGVTWTTYASAVSSPNCEEFLVMPDSVWLYIWKTKYWDKVQGDLIQNQAIANAYASWAWGSGVTGANNLMQSMLMNEYGYPLSQVSTPANRTAILNKLAQEDSGQLFDTMIKTRENFFRSLSTFSTFGSGWLARLRDFESYNRKYITGADYTNRLIVMLLVLAALMIGLYFALR